MKRLLILLAVLCAVQSVKAWHQNIHAGITTIVDANLTPETKAAIADYLPNKSLLFYANWHSFVEKDTPYKEAAKWHHIAIDKKGGIMPIKKVVKSKNELLSASLAYDGLSRAIATIQNRAQSTKEEVAAAICFLVHIMADMHCPTHYVYADMPVEERMPEFFLPKAKKSENYQKFWEYEALTNTFNWRAGEYCHQLNRKTQEEVGKLTAGSVEEWLMHNAEEYRSVYRLVSSGVRFDKSAYRLWNNRIYPIAVECVTAAGYRTAHLLNVLFDSDAEPIWKTSKK